MQLRGAFRILPFQLGGTPLLLLLQLGGTFLALLFMHRTMGLLAGGVAIFDELASGACFEAIATLATSSATRQIIILIVRSTHYIHRYSRAPIRVRDQIPQKVGPIQSEFIDAVYSYSLSGHQSGNWSPSACCYLLAQSCSSLFRFPFSFCFI